MATEKVRFTEERETMLATLYLRALDSKSKDPILGDDTAAETVRKIDYDFEKIGLTSGNAPGVAMRARLLDEWTREFLAEHPDATVLHLACGLDTRVHRLDPPASVRWFDVDFPEIIELRERLYPPRDGYRMIGTSVTDEGWLEQLPNDRPTVVIAEGLTMYLRPEAGRHLFRQLVDYFPSGQLIFDCFGTAGIKSQKLNRAVRKSGPLCTGLSTTSGRSNGCTPSYAAPTRSPASRRPGWRSSPRRSGSRFAPCR